MSVIGYVSDWRRLKGQRLTKADIQLFGEIDSEVLENDMHRCLPGVNPWTERIDPVNRAVVYMGSDGRRTISFRELGYKEIDGTLKRTRYGGVLCS